MPPTPKSEFDLSALISAIDVSLLTTAEDQAANTDDSLPSSVFKGDNIKTPHGRLFGGQVLAQSVSAAQKTVEKHALHSCHAYFVRAGSMEYQTTFKVDTIRQGRSFILKQITAMQNNKAIFIMQASFQLPEEGLEHQISMPDVPAPDELKSDQEIYRSLAEEDPRFKMKANRSWPIEVRHIGGPYDIKAGKREGRKVSWMKTSSAIPGNYLDNQALHKTLFTYASDMTIWSTSLLPHGAVYPPNQISGASLDHAMWFYRPIQFDEWLLYVQESPVSYGARGLNRANVFNQKGELVAAVTQEGLIRKNRSYTK